MPSIDERIIELAIKLNPKNAGKFTATEKRTGKSVEQLAHSKNPLTRKRAVFAENAKHWKHDKRELSAVEEIVFFGPAARGTQVAKLAARIAKKEAIEPHTRKAAYSLLTHKGVKASLTRKGTAEADSTRAAAAKLVRRYRGVERKAETRLSSVQSHLIEFAKLDLGQDDEFYGGTCAPSKREKRYPTLYIHGRKSSVDVPKTGKATVEYRVRSRSMHETKDGENHSADIEILSLDPHEEDGKKKSKEGAPAKLLKTELAALHSEVIRFDGRPRNAVGEFANQQEGAPNPAAMEVTYRSRLAQPGVEEGASGLSKIAAKMRRK